MKVLVVGAGVAGLACAGALRRGGVAVTLLDKGRRPGGRVATRRTEGLTFNHGAQFVTAHHPGFAAVLAALQASGRAAAWPAAGDGRIVFLPGMSALAAFMASDLPLLTERHAGWLHASDAGWAVRHFPASDMRPGQTAATGGVVSEAHDVLVIAAPAPQAAALLATAAHPFAAAAGRAVIAPCWAAMAYFTEAVPGPDILQPGGGAIAWAARESSRPSRHGEPDAWTVHATPAWSRAHREDSGDDVATALEQEFRILTGAAAAASVRAHRWRHALVETAVGVTCLWDRVGRIGACGDWCLGPRVEAAFDSGLALAARILGEAGSGGG